MHQGPFFPALHRILALIHNFLFQGKLSLILYLMFCGPTQEPLLSYNALGNPPSCLYNAALGNKNLLAPHPSDGMNG